MLWVSTLAHLGTGRFLCPAWLCVAQTAWGCSKQADRDISMSQHLFEALNLPFPAVEVSPCAQREWYPLMLASLASPTRFCRGRCQWAGAALGKGHQEAWGESGGCSFWVCLCQVFCLCSESRCSTRSRFDCFFLIARSCCWCGRDEIIKLIGELHEKVYLKITVQ